MVEIKKILRVALSESSYWGLSEFVLLSLCVYYPFGGGIGGFGTGSDVP